MCWNEAGDAQTRTIAESARVGPITTGSRPDRWPSGLAASYVAAATNAKSLRSSATALWPWGRKFGDNHERMCGMSDRTHEILVLIPEISWIVTERRSRASFERIDGATSAG
jgi:hypothetical protein